ncbi:hypothetical protein B566_EDAN012495 [Ephemera danica]|nr:hypothetical protein B566_EDAN012495 [Ephemera danica]
MTILKFAMSTVAKGCIGGLSVSRSQSYKVLLSPTSAAFVMAQRNGSSDSNKKYNYRVNQLTKNLALLSNSGMKLGLEKCRGSPPEAGTAVSLQLSPQPASSQPMVVMLSWLMSKPKHVHKYARLYLKLGFDVLTVSINPWQLLWPVKGSQLVAKDLLTFLETNSELRPLLIHGFSVGGYVWGELLSHAERDRDRYSAVMQRISGHIWDSAADMQDIEHYIRSSQMFHSSMVRSPALLLFSERDPVGNPDSNLRLNESWEALGMKTYLKVFEKSPHVGHYHYYPEEYVAEVAAFLANIDLLPVACKVQAKAKL